MNWTVLVAFCIIDDLLKALGHKDDPQCKSSASMVLTLHLLACWEFGGNQRKALRYAIQTPLVLLHPQREPLQPATSCPASLGSGAIGGAEADLGQASEYALDTLPLAGPHDLNSPPPVRPTAGGCMAYP